MNVNVEHAEPVFFTDCVTVSHGPAKFVLDFTQSVPRFDTLGGAVHQTLVVKHRTLLMDPAVAKSLLAVMQDNIEKYERQFGKIELPRPKKATKKTFTVETASRYIG